MGIKTWKPITEPDAFEDPRVRWNRAHTVNVPEDLFAPAVPDETLADVLAVIAFTPHHTYRIPTQHPDRQQLLTNPEFGAVVQTRMSAMDAYTALAYAGRFTWPLRNVQPAHQLAPLAPPPLPAWEETPDEVAQADNRYWDDRDHETEE
ncbi:DUF5131 family protein [Streptomyces sp. NPDC096310]|uniref:DUF5131 family protein n=1 Tax=Streptomyces sp. NPDC096310 TaxID=3366082 RepID=UPI0037FB7506